MTGVYRIADIIFKVTSLYSQVHILCKDYRYDGDADFSIFIEQKDIDYEKEKSEQLFSDQYLETLAVYRKIAEIVPALDTFLFHGSAIAVDEKCYLFAAKSGTGKSTHTRLWRQNLGNRAIMVNDDKPLIHVEKEKIIVFGTPWNGKHRLGNSISVPLKAICFLERSNTNSIERITSEKAYQNLIQQTYRPSDHASMIMTLKLLERVSEKVSFYKLKCNMEIDAAILSYETMSRG